MLVKLQSSFQSEIDLVNCECKTFAEVFDRAVEKMARTGEYDKVETVAIYKVSTEEYGALSEDLSLCANIASQLLRDGGDTNQFFAVACPEYYKVLAVRLDFAAFGLYSLDSKGDILHSLVELVK